MKTSITRRSFFKKLGLLALVPAVAKFASKDNTFEKQIPPRDDSMAINNMCVWDTTTMAWKPIQPFNPTSFKISKSMLNDNRYDILGKAAAKHRTYIGAKIFNSTL